MEIIIPALLGMGGAALVLSFLLYVISKKFQVHEDSRLGELEARLPGANCGACGYPGCSGFARALLKASEAGDMGGLFCPPSGQDGMNQISDYLGLAPVQADKQVAVLRCGGSCETAPRKVKYSGTANCTVSNGLYTGEGGCAFGCLGQGECVEACTFDAMRMNPETGLPEIDPEKCTACGACVKTCPRNLIQLRPYGKRGRRVWVNCRNLERGALARKNCSTACIACGKCVKVCDGIAQAITIENNVASIDPLKCIACGKCAQECPTQAIVCSFPLPKKKEAQEPKV